MSNLKFHTELKPRSQDSQTSIHPDHRTERHYFHLKFGRHLPCVENALALSERKKQIIE